MKVFISYASADRATAERLYGDLKAAGAEPFEFQASTIGDLPAFQEIIAWIAGCDAFVVLVSAAALGSRAVDAEINVALHHHINAQRPRKIVPAMLEPGTDPPQVVQHFSRVDLADYDAGRATLLTRLGLDVPSPAEPAFAPPVDLDDAAPMAAPLLRREGDHLVWDPVPNAGRYVVAKRIGRGGWVEAYTGADTSVLVSPMSYNLMAVEYRARAIGGDDTRNSPWSASVVFGPGAARAGIRPGPIALEVTVGTVATMLTWPPVPDAFSYELERGPSLAPATGARPWETLYTGTNEAFVDTDRSGDHAYRVRAHGPWGDTDWSDSAPG